MACIVWEILLSIKTKIMKSISNNKTRREFITTTAKLGILPLIPSSLESIANPLIKANPMKKTVEIATGEKSIIGGYGPWVSNLVNDPPPLSFRNDKWNNLTKWKEKALEKTKELVLVPNMGDEIPEVTITKKYEYDGLSIEELEWQLPYGRKTEAILLKPANTTGSLPAVLGLHDHGGNKYFGKRKITKTSDQMHPMMIPHQEASYTGIAWANELAKKGYVVLVHDTFTFGSRRVKYDDISQIFMGSLYDKRKKKA